MDAKIIRSYFKKVPAVICTAGSYIAKRNPFAKEKHGIPLEGERLFERMSPECVLKYEAHFASCRKGDAFSFVIDSGESELYAFAMFDSIYSRRFAEVLLFESRQEMEAALLWEAAEPADGEMAVFAAALLDICDSVFEPQDKRGLIELKSTTENIISRIADMGICAHYRENEEAEKAAYMPADIPMDVYQQMVLLIVMAMNSVGAPQVTVTLSKIGDGAELSGEVLSTDTLDGIFDVDSLLAAFPAASTYLSLCRYIAELYECTVQLRRDGEGRVALILSMGEKRDIDVDFKSRDSLLYFDEGFEFSLKYISALSADAEQ